MFHFSNDTITFFMIFLTYVYKSVCLPAVRITDAFSNHVDVKSWSILLYQIVNKAICNVD